MGLLICLTAISRFRCSEKCECRCFLFVWRNNRRGRRDTTVYSKGVLQAASTSSSADMEQKLDLMKRIRGHEVAIAELGALSASRAVYQKNGNIFFRTPVQKVTASEQKQLDLAKAKLQKINPA